MGYQYVLKRNMFVLKLYVLNNILYVLNNILHVLKRNAHFLKEPWHLRNGFFFCGLHFKKCDQSRTEPDVLTMKSNCDLSTLTVV